MSRNEMKPGEIKNKTSIELEIDKNKESLYSICIGFFPPVF